jgi:hypothetical protein
VSSDLSIYAYQYGIRFRQSSILHAKHRPGRPAGWRPTTPADVAGVQCCIELLGTAVDHVAETMRVSTALRTTAQSLTEAMSGAWKEWSEIHGNSWYERDIDDSAFRANLDSLQEIILVELNRCAVV